jgi:hypothetical protein
MFTNIKVKYKNEYYNVKAGYDPEEKRYGYLTLKIKPEEETDPKAIAKQNKIFVLALKILNKKTKSKYEMYDAECEDGEVTFWICQKNKTIKEDYFPY